MFSTLDICYATIPKKTANKKRKSKFQSLTSNSLFKDCSEMCEFITNILEDAQENIYNPLNIEIIKFISELEFSSERIPTVGLFTGINLPDHDKLFATIEQTIKENAETNCCLIQLDPAKASTVKSLVESTVYSFVTYEDEQMNPKKSQCTLPYLLNWYTYKYGFISELEDLSSENLTYMIIVIPNIEEFPTSVLEDFLVCLSIYRDQIPLIFFFGVPTSMNRIYKIFSSRILSRLSIHFVQTEPSVIFLDKVVEEVLLSNDCPFLLEGKVFEFLTELFLYYNFSIKEFIRGVKLCITEHFYNFWNPMLCCHSDDVPRKVDSLDDNEIIRLLELSSLKAYNTKRKMDNLPLLTKELSNINEELENLLSKFHLTVKRFRLAIRCLDTLLLQMTNNSSSASSLVNISDRIKLLNFGLQIQIQLKEIYIEAMKSNATKNEWIKERFAVLQFLSKEALIIALNDMSKLLKKNEEDELINNIYNELQKHLELVKKSDILKVESSPLRSPHKIEIAGLNRSEFRKNLQINANKNKVSSEFETARGDVLNFILEEFFKRCMKPLNSYPMHELFIFSDVETIKHRLDGMTRTAIHSALENPSQYLNCECCVREPGEIDENMPDTCILYKLHHEHGDRINMHDWLEQFRVYVDTKDDDDENVSDEIYARFMHAVKELHHLGFITERKRKSNNVDYVVKLTF